jgi:hypothetical protein
MFLAMDKDLHADHPSDLAAVELFHDSFGRLVLADPGGRRHVGVEPIRCFPFSDPNRWVSLCDAEGVEVLWIENLDALQPAVRKLLDEELARREFMPVIQRIVHVSSNTDPSRWRVETDRGLTEFLLKTEDDVRRVGPRGAILVDSAGMRYLVPDTRRLDAAGRRVLERYL